MSYEVVNSLRSKSVVRVTGNTATTITLSSLSANENETITAATISQAIASTDGWWRIYRGDDTSGPLVLELYQSNILPFSQYDITVANTATSNIHVTNSGTGGSLILMLSKTASYVNDVDTGKVI